jgi:DNA repair protein RecO (recombination protein O)
VQLYRGRDLDVVTQFEVVDPFSAVRGDLDRLGQAAVLLEAVEKVAQDREPNPALYHLLVGALRSLERADRTLLVAGFLLKLLAQEGVGPSYEACAGCGRSEDLAFFDAGAGGVRCLACGGGLPLPPGSLEALVAISEDRLREVIDLPRSPLTDAVERAAMLSFERHAERRLRAPQVLAEHARHR